jgi:hypothetical protein
MAVGTATINFGSWPGAQETSLVVSGQAGILSTSNVEAYFMASDTTADHSANDHKYAPCFIKLSCGSIVVGTSFTIFARCQDQMQGTFLVHWVWAT